MAGIIKTSINLTAIDKSKVITGKKGKYLPITITVNNDVDAYGNHGPVAIASVVWTDGEFPQPVKRDQQQAAPAQPQVAQDDLPF